MTEQLQQMPLVSQAAPTSPSHPSRPRLKRLCGRRSPLSTPQPATSSHSFDTEAASPVCPPCPPALLKALALLLKMFVAVALQQRPRRGGSALLRLRLQPHPLSCQGGCPARCCAHVVTSTRSSRLHLVAPPPLLQLLGHKEYPAAPACCLWSGLFSVTGACLPAHDNMIRTYCV